MRAAAAIAAVAIAATGAVAAADPTPTSTEVRGRAELIGAGVYEAIAGDGETRFELDRAEVGGTVLVRGHGHGELTLEAVRSAGPDSFAGIDGNSILIRVKRAAAGGRWRLPHDVAIGADLGLVADPWLAALDDYPLRALGISVAEEQGLIVSSDLGATATAGVGRVAQLTATVTNGEGAHQVERNDGKDTSIVATVRPPLSAAAGELAIVGYGRDGSIGPGSTRSHRLGGAVTWHHPRAAAGADLVRAWGVGDRPDVLALTIEAWADVRAIDRFGAGARWDRLEIDGPTQDLRRWRATGALWYELADGVRGLAAVQLERAVGGDAAIGGVPAATDATRFTLTVQGSFEGAP